jgi:hypothetical protein
MITISLTCNSSTCSNHLVVPLANGSIFPTIDSRCRFCNGMLVINEIDGMPVKDAMVTSSTKMSYLTSNHDSNLGQRHILSGFVNRISPTIVLVQLIDEISDEHNVVTLHQLIPAWMATSNKMREKLRKIEDAHKIGRGERLSDGFPSSDPEKYGPMRISLRSLLGTDGTHILKERGLLQQYDFVERLDGSVLRLTERSKSITSLPKFEKLLVKSSVPEMIGERPKLPLFIPPDLAKQMIAILQDSLPDEYEWMLHILNLIEKSSDDEFGWDSNAYAQYETNRWKDGGGHPRWMKSDDLSLWDNYMDRGQRKGYKKAKRIEFASDRLCNYINSILAGLLGRMKEMGLIHPVRVGHVKNFLITDFGRETSSFYAAAKIAPIPDDQIDEVEE